MHCTWFGCIKSCMKDVRHKFFTSIWIIHSWFIDLDYSFEVVVSYLLMRDDLSWSWSSQDKCTNVYVWTPYFGSCASHSMTGSIFIWKIDLLIKNDLESPLILSYFLKRVNKIRKKNSKCDSWFWKRRSTKNRIGLGGQVTYRECTVKTITPL